jgi:alkanesulfonate monooxygenase SsuD/methylene tetrahydromethanopterin reductase-like flavin-dependent oxidoreductase (luciferase family)
MRLLIGLAYTYTVRLCSGAALVFHRAPDAAEQANTGSLCSDDRAGLGLAKLGNTGASDLVALDGVGPEQRSTGD